MMRVFDDLACDPGVSRGRVVAAILTDLWHGAAPGLLLGVPAGAAILLIWYVGRSDNPPGIDITTGLAMIAAVLLLTSYMGARLRGSFVSGAWTALVAGCVAALTIPGDAVIFGIFPFYSGLDLGLTVSSMVLVVMALGSLGAIAGAMTSPDRAPSRSA
jgi:Mg/Co/Ni transporter MgtE